MPERHLDDDDWWEATKGVGSKWKSVDPLIAAIREYRGEHQRVRRHGTTYCYGLGCRRPECVEAKSEYEKARRQNNKNTKKREKPKHGTLSRATNYGCSCGPCKKARREYLREWRGKKRLRKARGQDKDQRSDSDGNNTTTKE